jgi:hypothetical protein
VASFVLVPTMWILLAIRNGAFSSNKNRSGWLLGMVVSGTAMLDDRPAPDLWGKIDRNVTRRLHAIGPNVRINQQISDPLPCCIVCRLSANTTTTTLSEQCFEHMGGTV